MSWKSGTGVSVDWDLGVPRLRCVEPGGVGETTISRHWTVGFVVSDAFCDDGEGDDVGVWEEGTVTSWKACMGRASKNSWATMNGTLSEPAWSQRRPRRGTNLTSLGLVPCGIDLTVSVHTIGRSAYLHVLW